MKAVWLSSTYYLDEAVQGLSANAERMLTRLLAYCGNAETSGYITETAIILVGLPRPRRLVAELVDAEILSVQPDGRWYFEAWPEWNSSGDALLARRKADRERQARRREAQRQSQPKSRETSRETSRDVTAPEKRREEKNSGYVPESASLSTARDAQAATPGADLVRELIPAAIPDAERTMLRIKASALLREGSQREDVAEGLRLYLAKPQLGAGALPSLVSEVIRARAAPATNGIGKPTQKALGYRQLGAELIEELHRGQP